MCEVEVSVSGVPALCGRKLSGECRFHLHRLERGEQGEQDKEEFVTIRVSGPGCEFAVAAVRQWLEARLVSGGVTMAELRRLDIRVKVARGIVIVTSPTGELSTAQPFSAQNRPDQKPFTKVA